MFNKKSQIIKCPREIIASFNKPMDDENRLLFFNTTEEIENANAQLEVDLLMRAMVTKSGGDCRYYEGGNHPLFDNRTEKKNWKKGFSVKIVYMTKDTNVKVLWGLNEKLSYRDKISDKVVSVGAGGMCMICVVNPEQFVRKVVGMRESYSSEDFKIFFFEVLKDRFTQAFYSVLDKETITYDRLDSAKSMIAKKANDILSKEFEQEWGVSLQNMTIDKLFMGDEDIKKLESVTEEAEHRKRLKEYLDELERLDDKQWEREKYLHQLELQDRAAYYEVMKVIGNDMGGIKGANFCSNCGHSYESSSQFCPNCGKPLARASITCSKCGKVSTGDSMFCAGCGNKF